MKRILNLIRLDLITMNGKKGGMLIVLLLMIVFFGLLGFLATPLIALYCPIFLGCMFVQTFYRNELKYNSGKLFGILPVSRRELVKARFLLTVGLYVIMTGLFHLLMLFSAHLKLYHTVMGEFDVLELLAKLAGNTISPIGLLNLLYFAAAAMGLTVIGFHLRMFMSDEENYRKSSKLLFKSDKKSKKRSIAAIIFLMLFILYVLFVTGMIPLSGVLSIIFVLLIQISVSANGILMGLLLLSWAFCGILYKYVCTAYAYENRDL